MATVKQFIYKLRDGVQKDEVAIKNFVISKTNAVISHVEIDIKGFEHLVDKVIKEVEVGIGIIPRPVEAPVISTPVEETKPADTSSVEKTEPIETTEKVEPVEKETKPAEAVVTEDSAKE